jgi:hypothetical protein
VATARAERADAWAEQLPNRIIIEVIGILGVALLNREKNGNLSTEWKNSLLIRFMPEIR